MDVSELLLPGMLSTLHFPVRNPFDGPMTISMDLQPFVQDWPITIIPAVLPDMAPAEPSPWVLQHRGAFLFLLEGSTARMFTEHKSRN